MNSDFLRHFPQIGFSQGSKTSTADYLLWENENIYPEGASMLSGLHVTADFVGSVFVWVATAEDRETFENAVQRLRLPHPRIPLIASVGAMTLMHVRDWVKIDEYKSLYMRRGGDDWKNYMNTHIRKSSWYSTVIVLSDGPYSGIPAEQVDKTVEEWKRISLTIRLHHEKAHVYTRQHYPSHKEAIRDEVIADAAGLIGAFGVYDKYLGRKFLGIEGNTISRDGRLRYYINEKSFERDAIQRALQVIEAADIVYKDNSQIGPLEFVELMEKREVSLLAAR